MGLTRPYVSGARLPYRCMRMYIHYETSFKKPLQLRRPHYMLEHFANTYILCHASINQSLAKHIPVPNMSPPYASWRLASQTSCAQTPSCGTCMCAFVHACVLACVLCTLPLCHRWQSRKSGVAQHTCTNCERFAAKADTLQCERYRNGQTAAHDVCQL